MVHLRTRGLTCHRDARTLFSRLDLTVSAGEVWRVEGPNGSGKTSLLRMLCGLSSDYEGDILWETHPLPQARRALQAATLYLGHQAGVNGTLTAVEHLRWCQALRGARASSSACWAALADVGLSGHEDVPVHRLSAGQQRRVSLARLKIEPAPLWVLDEPFTALDHAGIRHLEAWIEQHARQGGSVIMTTHQPLNVAHAVKRLCLDGVGGHDVCC